MHVLNDEDIHAFHFEPNIWSTTLLFCSFQWEPSGLIHWYDVYTPRDEVGYAVGGSQLMDHALLTVVQESMINVNHGKRTSCNVSKGYILDLGRGIILGTRGYYFRTNI